MATSRWIPLAITLLLARPPVSAAQVPRSVQPVAPGVGSIRGEVFDSLAGNRLEGAHVRVQGTALRATTDRQGRFRLDSVPAGRRVLVLDHPALDSIGITDLPWAVEVADGSTTEAVLAVPSLRTFVATVCAAFPAQLGADSGIIFGSVRDAERGLRLAGARVVVSWIATDRSRRPPRVSRLGRDVLTDSLGNYYVCGVAGGVGLAVAAAAGSFASGELQLEVGERSVLRFDLSVSREAPLADADTAWGTRRGLATLVGSVRRERGGPLEGAQASVLGAPTLAVSEADGYFVLRDLPSGSQMLLVRRVGFGFSAMAVELRNRDTTRVSLELQTVTLLDTIRVTASRWVRSEIDELESRLRAGSISRVRTAQDLAAIGTIHAALQEFPLLSVSTMAERARRGSSGIQMRRGSRACAPDVYVDGWKVDLEVLEQYRPTDLIALEVYPGSPRDKWLGAIELPG